MGLKDLKSHHIDVLTDDWPITYDEVKPFYDKVDRLVGVYGTVEAWKASPTASF
jgi:choline dehydrogenase-like flavoprotein